MAGPIWLHRVLKAESQSKHIEIKIMNSPIHGLDKALPAWGSERTPTFC